MKKEKGCPPGLEELGRHLDSVPFQVGQASDFAVLRLGHQVLHGVTHLSVSIQFSLVSC